MMAMTMTEQSLPNELSSYLASYTPIVGAQYYCIVDARHALHLLSLVA